MPRSRRLPAVGLTAAVTAVLLAGCTFLLPQTSDDALPTVKIDTPEIPAELRQPSAQVVSSGGVAPRGRHPALIALSRQTPGSTPTAEVWSSSDGLSWKRVDGFQADPDASLTEIGIVASDDLVVVGANSWSKGVIRPVLWTSPDGARWSRVDLPDDMGAGFRPVAYAALGDRLIVLAEDSEGRTIGAVGSSGSWKRVRLPSIDDDQRLNVIGLDGTADRAVLIARPAKTGSSGPVRSFTSADDGATWRSGGVLTEKNASILGAVVSASAVVVTGSIPDGNAVARPVVWSSEDGRSWTSQQLPAPAESDSTWSDIGDVRLDAPVLGSDSSISAVMVNEDSAYSTVWTRASDGSWVEVGQTGLNFSNGEDGVAFSLGDGRFAVMLGGNGWARTGVLSSEWAGGTVFAPREDEFVPSSASPFAGGVVIPSTRIAFEAPSAGRWLNTTQSRLGRVSGSGDVSVVRGIPEEAAAFSSPVYGSAGRGGVVLGNTWDGVGPILAAGFASSDGTTWSPATGFPADGATEPSSVRRIGSQWVATVARRSVTSAVAPAHAGVYVSSDGLAWTAAQGDFGSGTLATAAYDVCEAPDGAPVVVGWIEREADRYSPAAWTSEGGDWTRMDLGSIGSADGYLQTCVGDGRTLTVSGEVSGRSNLLSVDAEHRWKRVFRAPSGDDIGRPVRVPGGFAADGSHGAGRASQAVVWLSRTGRDWSPVAIPTLRSGYTSGVARLGDDLVVAMPPSVGGPIAVIRDIRSVIEQNAR